MFSDTPVENDSFTIIPTTKSEESFASSQTVELQTNNQGSQTVLVNESDSQTCAEEKKISVTYDPDRLASFLKRVYSAIINDLNETLEIKVAPEVKVPDTSNDVEENDTVISESKTIKTITYQGKAVSSLSWNSSGKLLAIAYCEPVAYESWCTHNGTVNVYDISDGKISAISLYTKETSSCPKCISFHPTKPNILAAGLANGTVMVWYLGLEDCLVPQGDKELKHTDNVNKILWSKDGHYCVTAGKDGRIIFWSIQGNELLGVNGYIIKSVYCWTETTSGNRLAEILSLDFWWEETNHEFIVTLAGGSILHCSTSETLKDPITPSYLDPVVMSYQPHSGIITDVKCSADMFATCGINSEIHVYKSKISTPHCIIHTDFALLGIEWVDKSKSNGVIACWGCSPAVYFFDVSTNEKLDSSLSLTEPNTVITAAKLTTNSNILAVGTRKGSTTVWATNKSIS